MSESGIDQARLDKRFMAKVRTTRAATRLAIATERLWPLLLPFALIVALFMAVSWFGLFRLVPDSARIAVATLFAVAAIGALVLPLRFRWPESSTVDRRLEKANRLEHMPVSTQSDRLTVSGDPFAEALWSEHKHRLAQSIGSLETDLPRTGIPSRDPYGLRSAIALLFVVALAYSTGPQGGSLGDAFSAHMASDTVPPRVDAWVTPPAYTARAPVYLTSKGNEGTQLFTVPAGSIVTVRVSGGSGDETLSVSGAGGETVPIGPVEDTAGNSGPARPSAARQFDHVLKEDGRIAISGKSGIIHEWQFAAIPDTAPEIRFNGEPGHAINGTLELSYIIEDDYGAASAEALFALAGKEDADARPLFEAPEMPLSVPRRGARITESRTTRDLTEHPWAGSRVTVQLATVDDAGQRGVSSQKTMVLPERIFTNSLAKAVVEQRRILALDANAKRRVLDLLDAITLRPEDTIPDLSHYLGLMSARTRLDMASTDDELREVVAYMWELARGIEEGDLSAAERRLRAAQEALKKALEEDASDQEIEQLMAELREALNEFMRELAERALENPELAQPIPFDGQELSQSDLERMLKQIEELAKSGARDKARELLSQLENMMNNLQAGRQQQGDGQQGQMREQMNRLGEMMRRQQELMNETFRNQQRRQQGQQSGRGQQGEQQQGQGGMTAEEFAEALRRLQEGQGQLRGDLGEFMKDLEGMGIDPGSEFGNAGESMGRAGEALGEGDGQTAIGEQGEALEALRRGAQGMMDQMQQAMQGQDGGTEEGGLNRRANRDPLGRPRATTGPDFGQSVEVPDEIDVQRARRILEAIRKRLGDTFGPQLEKDYLERLLQPR